MTRCCTLRAIDNLKHSLTSESLESNFKKTETEEGSCCSVVDLDDLSLRSLNRESDRESNLECMRKRERERERERLSDCC